MEQVVKELKRIGDLLEKSQSDSVLRKENENLQHQLSMKEAELEFLQSEGNKPEVIALSPVEVKLSDSFTDAVVRDLSVFTEGSQQLVRETLEKWTPRYFAHANDTEVKLAKAFEELHGWRTRGHRDRMDAFVAVKKLAESTLATPQGEAVTAMASGRLNKFFHDLNTLIELNQPRREEVGGEEAQQGNAS